MAKCIRLELDDARRTCDSPVAMHYQDGARVYLIAENPGRMASASGIPLYGSMGGELYRMLWETEIKWVRDLSGGLKFSYPVKFRSEYTRAKKRLERRLQYRDDFLNARRRYLACSNALDRRITDGQSNCVTPELEEVLSDSNRERLKDELRLVRPSAILIASSLAYAALVGEALLDPEKHEGQPLAPDAKAKVQKWAGITVKDMWYLGHPRRWRTSPQSAAIRAVWRNIAQDMGWT